MDSKAADHELIGQAKFAIKADDLNALAAAIAAGADLDTFCGPLCLCGGNGFRKLSILEAAGHHGRVDAWRLIDPSNRLSGSQALCSMPLLAAARMGQTDFVRFLLESGWTRAGEWRRKEFEDSVAVAFRYPETLDVLMADPMAARNRTRILAAALANAARPMELFKSAKTTVFPLDHLRRIGARFQSRSRGLHGPVSSIDEFSQRLKKLGTLSVIADDCWNWDTDVDGPRVLESVKALARAHCPQASEKAIVIALFDVAKTHRYRWADKALSAEVARFREQEEIAAAVRNAAKSCAGDPMVNSSAIGAEESSSRADPARDSTPSKARSRRL